MSTLTSLIRRAPKRLFAAVAVIAAAIIVPAAVLAWGPDRPTFTIEQPANYVTFNSITNNPVHGDERNFVLVKEKGAADSTYTDDITLEPGKEYTMYMYFHNNAATSLNESGKGVAKDVTMRAEIPALVKAETTDTKAVGFVNASNAQPKSVWDHVNFDNPTDGDVALRLLPGSAKINSFGAVDGTTLSDSIVSTGVPLGYDQLNGTLPGCNEYAGYVTFDLKADQANFTVEKQVREHGTSDWKESITAQPGQTVDYLVQYKNTGTTRQNDVVIKDQLPKGMTYVNGSTKVANSNNPNGIAVDDGITTESGINIGNYEAGANAFVMFSAKVKSLAELECGTNSLKNVARADTNNGWKEDDATVTVTKECEPGKITVCELKTDKIITINEADFDSSKHSKDLDDCKELPPELPKTGPAEDIVAILRLGALIASIAYYVASRRALV